MPDDPNLFDDDSLMPSWLSDWNADSDADDQASTAAPSSRPLWETAPGEAPPKPRGLSSAAPPWETAPGSGAPPPAGGTDELPPWASSPGEAPPQSDADDDLFGSWDAAAPASSQPATDDDLFGDWETVPGSETGAHSGPRTGLTGRLEDDSFSWNAPAGTSTDRPQASGGEIPRGLTGALPWMGSEQPSQPETEDDWMREFEPAPEEEEEALPDTLWSTDKLTPAEPAPMPDEPFTMSDLLSEFEEDEPPAAPPPKQPSLRDRLKSLSPEKSTPPPEQAAEPAVSASDMPDWLSEMEPEFEEVEEEEIAAPASEIPDWLAQAGPASEEIAEARAEKPGIRRIQQEPEPAMDGDLPDWMTFDDEFGDLDMPKTGELTYDEWEQQEIERQQEAQKTPEERMAEQVPEWFDKLDNAPAPAAESERPSEPEFVPDWFLGLEEQDAEAAPDWFQKLDYDTGSLAAPPSDPTSQPAAEDSADVPDWFKGADLPETSGADWAALFGAPSDDLPMPDMGSLSGGDVMAEPEDIPFPDMDLDALPPDEAEDSSWMMRFAPSDGTPGALRPPNDPLIEPEQDNFVERFDLDQLSDGGDAPDWLREMADEGETLPVPDDLFAAGPEGASDSLDWLNELSPDDLQESEPAPREVPQREEEDLFGSKPLSSGALDQLLGLHQEPEPLPEPDEDMPDLDALFAEADRGLDLPDADELFGADEDGFFGTKTESDSAFDEWPEEEPTGPAADEDMPDLDDLFAEAESADSMPGMEELFPTDASKPTRGEAKTKKGAAPEAPSIQPEWLAEMRPSDLPVTIKVGGAERNMPQKQIVELPDRLRAFHESSMKHIPPAAQQSPAEAGPLAGVEGALPLAEIMLQQEAAAPIVAGAVITPEQAARATRLQSLLDLLAAEEEDEELASVQVISSSGEFDFKAETDEEAPAPRRARRQTRLKPDRVIVALLLLIGLIAPFATDALHFAADPPTLSGDRLAAASALDALQPGQYVLVALEYGPAHAGELDALTEAVLRTVLARRAIPLTTSTNPAGAFHAEALITPLAQDARLLSVRDQGETTLIAGTDYVLLSYLPGEAVGVRGLTESREDASGTPKLLPAFETNIRGEKSGVTVTSLERDIALVVVVGGESGAMRTWAEQLTDVQVPKVALVTAALEPLTIPYVNKDAYAGYLAGYRDTYRYNQDRNANSREPYHVPDGVSFDIPNPEESRWHSMALGALVAAGLITAGMVANLFRALRRRRQQ